MRKLVALCAVPMALFQGCSSTSAHNAGAGDAGGVDAGVAADADLESGEGGATRDVVLVGNTVSGTVSFLDGHTFKSLGSINVLPDLQARLAEIAADSTWATYYRTIKMRQSLMHFEPSNGDRFVDDVFVSPDGTKLYVSRSNLGDVAAFDLSTPSHPMLWRTRVDGYKADHATLSPDGSRLVVSATSADVADVIDANSGAIVGSFNTGHYPHQNDFSADGAHIYNGSIGDVSLPFANDAMKGARQITVVDAKTLMVVKTYTFAEGVRPSVITADEKTIYLQQSFLNGLVKYDTASQMITDTVTEPMSAFAQMNYPTKDDYPHDSAHHGLALSGDGTKLCDLGTIDGDVSIVSTASMMVTSTVDVGLIPYWATTSVDGASCLVSLSGDGVVAVVGYATGQVMSKTPVGKFPQRSRLGHVPDAVLTSLSPSPG